MSDLQHPDHLDHALAGAVRALSARSEQLAGAPPLSDQALADLGNPDVDHVLLVEDDTVTGYGQRSGSSAEVVALDPATAGRLIDALTDAPGPHAPIWSHGAGSVVGPALAERGWQRTRELRRLRREGSERRNVELPEGVHLRAFVPGRDEDALLAVNARAFAHHPEQGGWTARDLAAREAEDWFEPAGVLLAERDGRLLGFHWTKLHPGQIGEVYVLAVDPDAQGLHLGRALLDAGLDHLAARGTRAVILYVDADNTKAVRLYEKSGFVTDDTDTQWTHPGDLSST